MKNQKLLLLTVISACLLALFGCAPSDSDGSSGGATLTGPIADLQGTWLTSCKAYDATYFAITKAKVSGTGLSQTTHFYTNSGCTVEAYKLSYILVDLNVGESITFTSGRTGFRYSFSQQTLELTSLNDIVTQVSNTQNYCGLQWITGEPHELSGLKCGSISHPVKNTTHFNIYQITGNNLYIGNASQTDYPTSVSEFPFVKQ